MLFTELRYFIFFGVVFAAYWTLSANVQRKWLLLACSYAFYAAWNWKFLILIVASTGIDFFIGGRLGAAGISPDAQPRRRAWLALSVSWNLGVLFFFKYFNFGIQSAQALLAALGLHSSVHTLQIVLPVGISFFTFQSMSYSIDIYRGNLVPAKSLLDFSTFIGFFPQLFSGPIVRAVDFLPQLAVARRFEDVRGRAMLVMFLVGFIKKACIADNLAPFVDEYFANPGHFNALGCWTAVLFYSAQIYCDFSGYTDMAIASAGLLGFEFCRNFDFPYFSSNVGEFWRRWHMSLSSWLRDYLYIPLGGNRGGTLLQYRNLLLTMVLGGLWHGAAWTFVIWGAIHGSALIVHRVCRRVPFLGSMLGTTGGIALTFLTVLIAWIFFRAPNLAIAAEVTRSFVTLKSEGDADFGVGCLVAFGALALIHWLAYKQCVKSYWAQLPLWQFSLGCGCLLASALPWAPLGYKPFIYFQF